MQYKKVNGKLMVLGLNNYSRIVFDKMSQLDNLVTQDKKINLFNVDMTTNTFEIKEEYSVYRFVSPWLALNENNYEKFKLLEKTKRREFLEKILVAGVLSALKGLGVRVGFQVSAQISKFKSIQTEAHKNKFIGFYCEFALNVTLPKFLGLGKSVSKGFGVVERIK
ncbi:MAG: CRISPR-associated endonuclease Cas6 [Thaumarchaeota archaeon]|nr:CRISPR-associated endonuclease Cas6 [Nitrososphaerota archaeon]